MTVFIAISLKLFTGSEQLLSIITGGNYQSLLHAYSRIVDTFLYDLTKAYTDSRITTTRWVGLIERDKLELLSANCGNAEST